MGYLESYIHIVVVSNAILVWLTVVFSAVLLSLQCRHSKRKTTQTQNSPPCRAGQWSAGHGPGRRPLWKFCVSLEEDEGVGCGNKKRALDRERWMEEREVYRSSRSVRCKRSSWR